MFVYYSPGFVLVTVGVCLALLCIASERKDVLPLYIDSGFQTFIITDTDRQSTNKKLDEENVMLVLQTKDALHSRELYK